MQIHFLFLQVTFNLLLQALTQVKVDLGIQSLLKGTASTILCLHLINQPKLPNLYYYLFNRAAP